MENINSTISNKLKIDIRKFQEREFLGGISQELSYKIIDELNMVSLKLEMLEVRMHISLRKEFRKHVKIKWKNGDNQ